MNMILTQRPPVTPPKPAVPTRHRMTVREMMTLVEAGMLEGHVELVDGELIDMPGQGNYHAVGMSNAYDLLRPLWPRPRFIRTQSTHRFADIQAPEPDLAMLDREPIDGALIDERPRLVIEISDSTLATDLGRKKLDYARFGVPEYWVLDLRRRRLYVFREPDTTATEAVAAWGHEQILTHGDSLAALCMPDVPIRVADLIDGPGA